MKITIAMLMTSMNSPQEYSELGTIQNSYQLSSLYHVCFESTPEEVLRISLSRVQLDCEPCSSVFLKLSTTEKKIKDVTIIRGVGEEKL